MSTIRPDQLASEINKILEEFQGVTEDAVGKGIIELADEAVNKLHEAHPSGSGKYGSWDNYNQSWKRTKLSASGRKNSFSSTVHNEKHYQLAHLLENGHALRNGGRSQAFPHIAPVAEEVERNLIKTIKKHIEQ